NAMVVLVVIAVLNSAIAAAYYLRIVASCYLRKPADGVRASPCRALQVSIAACALVVLAVFLRPGVLFDRARDAMDRAETARVATVDVDDSQSATRSRNQ
ncbi:MAG: hypothetical protein O7B26_12905, partial [Planctomycetota bacterium]|nr:hypothetical protein [Planctomycetota bacterium]